MAKNPFMSAWLSWANRATGMWTAAAMSAARSAAGRNQSAALKSMMTPPKSAKPKRKAKPAR